MPNQKFYLEFSSWCQENKKDIFDLNSLYEFKNSSEETNIIIRTLECIPPPNGGISDKYFDISVLEVKKGSWPTTLQDKEIKKIIKTWGCVPYVEDIFISVVNEASLMMKGIRQQ